MKGERQYRMSAVDWLLLIGFLSVVGAGWLLLRAGGRETSSIELVYTIRISDMEAVLLEDDASATLVGCAIRSANGTAVLGRVESVRRRPHRMAVVAEERICFVDAPDSVDLDLSVRANGSFRAGDGLRISDVRIAAGEIGRFRVGMYDIPRATIVAVAWRETEGVA